MLAERLEEKTSRISQLLTKYKNNWLEIFYVQLARGFGLHINQDAFEKLAMQTPLTLLGKHKNNPLQVEALLFGQAGFLFDYFDEPIRCFCKKSMSTCKSFIPFILWINTIGSSFDFVRPISRHYASHSLHNSSLIPIICFQISWRQKPLKKSKRCSKSVCLTIGWLITI